MSELSKNQIAKAEIIEEIKEKVKKADSVVLVEYKGLSVAQDTALRTNFRKNQSEYKVYKNRYIQRAFNELGFTGLDKHLEGNTAMAFSYGDEVMASKLVFEEIKRTSKLSAKAGIVAGNIVDSGYIEALSKIPSKDVLIAQLLGMLQAPIRGLACVLDQAAKKQSN